MMVRRRRVRRQGRSPVRVRLRTRRSQCLGHRRRWHRPSDLRARRPVHPVRLSSRPVRAVGRGRRRL